jgi:hypothetical protein
VNATYLILVGIAWGCLTVGVLFGWILRVEFERASL